MSTRINWSKALGDYLKDETQSYFLIASKYSVSLQAVKKRAGREGWQDLRQKSIQKVNQELPRLIGEDLARISARQVRVGEVLQSLGLKVIIEKRLEPKSFNEAVNTIKDGAKIERDAIELGAEERKSLEMSNSLKSLREEYGFGDGDEEPQKIVELVHPIIEKVTPVNTLPPVQANQRALNATTLVLTPQFLEGIQIQLKKIQEGYINLEKKINAPTTVQPDAKYGWINRN